MARGEDTFFGSDQFWIQELGLDPEVSTWDQSNGLVVTASHGAVILTSEYMGPARVTVDARDLRPDEADDPYGLTGDQEWDDIVEISIRSVHGPMRVVPLDDSTDLPRLDAAGPGAYRLRVHARNRDAYVLNHEGHESSTGEYRISSWPEPHRPPLLIRLTDRRGLSTRVSLLPPLDA